MRAKPRQAGFFDADGTIVLGAEFADDLERVLAEHGAETVAAVVVEPMAGSTGVLVPPVGYLERLRGICDRHGILLIFDEVITGFGRLGTPFASQYFDVIPDMFTFAKGVNNATVPMGGVVARDLPQPRSCAGSRSPMSGRSRNGSAGLMPATMCSMRLLTLPRALGWLKT